MPPSSDAAVDRMRAARRRALAKELRSNAAALVHDRGRASASAAAIVTQVAQVMAVYGSARAAAVCTELLQQLDAANGNWEAVGLPQRALLLMAPGLTQAGDQEHDAGQMRDRTALYLALLDATGVIS